MSAFVSFGSSFVETANPDHERTGLILQAQGEHTPTSETEGLSQ
jgi:hypothetical protein